MSEHIRVPDPVYERLKQEAEEKDTSIGGVVRDWMKDSDELERMKRSKGQL